ncbi:hypothetical protein [Saccharothrix sp. Mg75]|uniref:hypothetical protein n=1 Tax=Saccharothrix sp. Mg75 TaxID=3445357 RepID=UPI003EEB8C9E
MSAGASRGALWFTVFTDRFTAPVFTGFLDRIELHLMPRYSLELNSGELLNADLKRNANAVAAENSIHAGRSRA